MMSIGTPSYAQGFARSAAESAHSELWAGLVAAWVPHLGPTGARFRDVVGHNHLGFVNLSPSTNWVVTDKGWAVQYDEADDDDAYGDAGIVPFSGSEDRTVIVYFTFTGTVPTDGSGLLSIDPLGGGSTGERWSFKINPGTPDTLRIEIVGSAYVTSLAPSTTDWNLAACILKGTTLGDHTLYLNGSAESASGTNAVNTNSTYRTRIGSHANIVVTSRSLDGKIGLVLAYNRALSIPEIDFIAEDPMALLRPRRHTFKAPAAAAATRPPRPGVFIQPGVAA